MGWLITISVFVLIGCLPMHVIAAYDWEGPVVKLGLGFLRFSIVPPKNRSHKKKKKPVKEKKKQAVQAVQEKKAESPKSKMSLHDLLPFIHLGLDFLGNLKRKLIVKNLRVHCVLAGGDPADLAIHYGRAWIALGNLMPRLEQFLHIRKRNLCVECDFTDTKTKVDAYLDISLTIGRALGLILGYAFRAASLYLRMIKLRKGGAQL